MRVGFNPHKDQLHRTANYFHQIVIPVYIPNQEEYFKDSFEILKLCLESLFKTIHNKTYVTIINNGSATFVVDYLNELYYKAKIQEIIHTTNIGYINAMLKGIAGQNLPIFTTSDCDVIFLNGWQEATYAVFEAFPKAGAVCPTPSSRSLRTHTANVYWDLFFSKKLKFTEVINPEAMVKFGISVGNKNFYNSEQLKKNLTIESNTNFAVVGAGHFVITYRASVFDKLEKRFTPYIMGGNSDDLFDVPVVNKGFWRLSTADNFAYHMGNVIEDWMLDTVSKLMPHYNKEFNFELKSIEHSSKLSYFIKSQLFAKLILNKKVMQCFLIWKGLSKTEAKEYI
jgi:Glycosyl transferase family 2